MRADAQAWFDGNPHRSVCGSRVDGKWRVKLAAHGRLAPCVNEVFGDGSTLDEAIDDAYANLEALKESEREAAR